MLYVDNGRVLTSAGVDTIASATGMGTATTLRRHFNRTVGVPPDTYRRTFRSTRPDRGPYVEGPALSR